MASRLLLIDDDADLAALVRVGLRPHGFETTICLSAEEGFAAALANDFDAVVTDVMLPGMSGPALCEQLRASRPDTPVLVITAHGTIDSAIASLRAGAVDFLTKPLDVTHLALALEREIRNRNLREEVKRLREVVQAVQPPGGILGESPAIRKLGELIRRVATTDASVLITGESGTGKELIAQAIHAHSLRRQGSLIAVNCAAMPEELLESELFGHVRGAFTDARATRRGLFLEAAGGTLFLDEIGEMPLNLQPKLLRVLQERTIRPLGSNAEVPVDVRIVAATNRDLETAVEEGRFRQDLFFRLNVISLEVPPLRARGNDVLLLAQAFLERTAAKLGKPVKGMLSATAQRLLAYDWPGNVRELQNCIERAVTFADFDQLSVEDLPESVRQHQPSAPGVGLVDSPDQLLPMEEVERRYIQRVLKAVGGNKTMAAKILGYDRKTLYRKLNSEDVA